MIYEIMISIAHFYRETEPRAEIGVRWGPGRIQLDNLTYAPSGIMISIAHFYRETEPWREKGFSEGG